MKEIIYFIFSSFWIFIGFLILLGGIANFIYELYSRTLRHYSLMKWGYPNNTCDADGNLETKKENEEE